MGWEGSCTQTSVKATDGGYGVSSMRQSYEVKGGQSPKTHILKPSSPSGAGSHEAGQHGCQHCIVTLSHCAPTGVESFLNRGS